VARRILLDQWSALDYKVRFANHSTFMAPSWVGDEHQRRLEAYKMLVAYMANRAAEYLESSDTGVRSKRREYGDPCFIVDTIVDAVIGEDARIQVDGAGQRQRDEAGNESPLDPTADQLQAWFDQWDADERPILTFLEGETDAVGLGDTLYEFAWDAIAQRPTVTVHDPGFYFPVLEDAISQRQYPNRIHVAWEFEREVDGVVRTYVRRITWELVDTGVAHKHPWNEQSTTISCLKSDGTWLLRGEDQGGWDDFDRSKATWAVNADGDEVNELDIDLDFIPVLHVPNTIARKEHYGRSSLALLLQLLDEIQAADSDLSLTARTLGFPPLTAKGGAIPTDTEGRAITGYRPGSILPGALEVLDTSNALDALLKYVAHLLKRLDVVARLAGAVVGRADPEQVASGVLYALAQQPLKSMVRRMRMVRDEKYPLGLKFVARIAMKAGQIPANTNLPTIRLAFGSFLPTDLAAEIARIIELFEAKLMSRATALHALVELGVPYDDVEAELAAIEREEEAALAAFEPDDDEGGGGGPPADE